MKILGLNYRKLCSRYLVNKDGRSVGLLNGNKDCSYAVFYWRRKILELCIQKQDELNKIYPIWSEIKKVMKL